MLEQFAQTAGINNLSVLVSAGSGETSSAVIVGTNGAGQSCWTIMFAGGGAGGPFRCGSKPGQDPGEPADQEVLRIVCETTGSAGSDSAESASCIGFADSAIATVRVNLADGSSREVNVQNGVFAYQADSSGTLPQTIIGNDSSGQAVAQRAVVLAVGPGNS